MHERPTAAAATCCRSHRKRHQTSPLWFLLRLLRRLSRTPPLVGARLPVTCIILANGTSGLDHGAPTGRLCITALLHVLRLCPCSRGCAGLVLSRQRFHCECGVNCMFTFTVPARLPPAHGAIVHTRLHAGASDGSCAQLHCFDGGVVQWKVTCGW